MDGILESFSPAEFAAGAADGYKVIDTSPVPAIPDAPYVDVNQVNGPVDGLDKDEKILIICAKGKRSYLLQNRLKFYGYTNTKVLEGGLSVNDVEVSE